MARWISRDPIGYDGGENLYAYCDGDPGNGLDPDGCGGAGREPAKEPLTRDPKEPVRDTKLGPDARTADDTDMNAAALKAFVDMIGKIFAKKRAGPYGNIKPPRNCGPGKDFTPATKRAIIQQNRASRDGRIHDDEDGTVLAKPTQTRKGEKRPVDEAHVDHIWPQNPNDPNAPQGSNHPSNARVISAAKNMRKSNN